MRSLRITSLLVVLALGLTSCVTFRASGLGMQKTTQQNVTVMGTFEKDVWVHAFLGSPAGAKLFNITAEATDEAVRDAIQSAISEKGGDAAIGVTIVHKASFGNMLVTWLTGNIYSPGTILVTGTVIKYN